MPGVPLKFVTSVMCFDKFEKVRRLPWCATVIFFCTVSAMPPSWTKSELYIQAWVTRYIVIRAVGDHLWKHGDAFLFKCCIRSHYSSKAIQVIWNVLKRWQGQILDSIKAVRGPLSLKNAFWYTDSTKIFSSVIIQYSMNVVKWIKNVVFFSLENNISKQILSRKKWDRNNRRSGHKDKTNPNVEFLLATTEKILYLRPDLWHAIKSHYIVYTAVSCYFCNAWRATDRNIDILIFSWKLVENPLCLKNEWCAQQVAIEMLYISSFGRVARFNNNHAGSGDKCFVDKRHLKIFRPWKVWSAVANFKLRLKNYEKQRKPQKNSIEFSEAIESRNYKLV